MIGNLPSEERRDQDTLEILVRGGSMSRDKAHNQVRLMLYEGYNRGPNKDKEEAKTDALQLATCQIRSAQWSIDQHKEGDPLNELDEKELSEVTEAIIATARGDWEPIKGVITKFNTADRKRLNNLAASL